MSTIDPFLAVSLVKEKKPDIILLDIIMPKIDGYEVCSQLKLDNETKDIPVIFISVKNEEIQKGFELGSVDYITKPFNAAELLARVKTHLELSEYRKFLELKVKEEVKKNKKQQEIVFQQNKLASVGEMIGNITHQWREPLASINAITSYLYESSERDTLSDDILKDRLDLIEKHTLNISSTIDNFLYYFNAKKDRNDFYLNDAVYKAIEILKNSLKNNNIKTKINIKKNTIIYGIEDDYIQILISIMTNSIYEFTKLSKKEKKEIVFDFSKINDKKVLSVIDNAGGIPIDIQNKIFEPYFTTKNTAQASGLGLYISKMLLDKNMQGVLSFDSFDGQTAFHISI